MKISIGRIALLITLGATAGCATIGYDTENVPISPILHAPETRAQPLTVAKTESTTPQFNIPVVVNREVEWFMRYFQTKNRRHFIRWLARSHKYIPLMEAILAQNELPTDLVYLAMIESGFNNTARSHRAAVGPWQFIRSTGANYGLKINWWIDERRDPYKSTLAASLYLKDLYDMFGSWFLAAAGYNAGENKIKRAIKKHRTKDFWEMTHFHYLKKETKQYIPKLIAATLIAKNPEKYGFFNIPYQQPLVFDTVIIDRPIDLRVASRVLKVPYKEIRSLNPELLRWCTPPGVTNYKLKIPLGKRDEFLAKYPQIRPKNKMIFQSHKIKRGDTLYRIARKYNTQVKPIMELNKIKSPRHLRPGQRIIIPVQAKPTKT